MIPHLIVRADASATIGLGHLVRSTALAHAWQDLGGEVALATATKPGAFPAAASVEGMDLVAIRHAYPDPGDLATVEKLAGRFSHAWVVCDGYGFDAEYTRSLSRAGFKTLVIDDQAHLPAYHAHALLNQNLGAERLQYRFDSEPIRFLGPRFALLERSFAAWRGCARSTPAQAASLLVTLGGGTATAVLDTIVRACRRIEVRPLRVTVLTGPQTTLQLESGHEAGSEVSFGLAANPADLPALMARADVAISAAGSTVWQLCFMGVPTAVVTLVDNQAGIACCLAEAGCAVNLGWHADLDEQDLADRLELLLRDASARVAMSARGRALVDGRGAERVAAVLLDLAA